MKSNKVVCLLALCLAGGACGGDAPAPETELTRRQKDTIISELPVPGAGGVGRAMDAVDRANARAAAHDSLR